MVDEVCEILERIDNIKEDKGIEQLRNPYVIMRGKVCIEKHIYAHTLGKVEIVKEEIKKTAVKVVCSKFIVYDGNGNFVMKVSLALRQLSKEKYRKFKMIFKLAEKVFDFRIIEFTKERNIVLNHFRLKAFLYILVLAYYLEPKNFPRCFRNFLKSNGLLPPRVENECVAIPIHSYVCGEYDKCYIMAPNYVMIVLRKDVEFVKCDYKDGKYFPKIIRINGKVYDARTLEEIMMVSIHGYKCKYCVCSNKFVFKNDNVEMKIKVDVAKELKVLKTKVINKTGTKVIMDGNVVKLYKDKDSFPIILELEKPFYEYKEICISKENNEYSVKCAE